MKYMFYYIEQKLKFAKRAMAVKFTFLFSYCYTLNDFTFAFLDIKPKTCLLKHLPIKSLSSRWIIKKFITQIIETFELYMRVENKNKTKK